MFTVPVVISRRWAKKWKKKKVPEQEEDKAQKGVGKILNNEK